MKTRLSRLIFALVLLLTALPGADVSASTCEEQAYWECQTLCTGVAEQGRCSAYASQACLCMRGPADCPICY